MTKTNKKLGRNIGAALLVGSMALGVVAPAAISQASYTFGFDAFNASNITVSTPERAGVNTTIFGWAVGTHPGHNRTHTIASGDGWSVTVNAFTDQPWNVTVEGDPMQDVIFWIYVQAASRNSVGGNPSTWTSRDVYRMQVVARGEGVLTIPIPEGAVSDHGYQLKLGDARFDNVREPVPTEPEPTDPEYIGIIPPIGEIDIDDDIIIDDDYIGIIILPGEIDPGIEIDLDEDDEEEYEYIDFLPLPDEIDPGIEIDLDEDDEEEYEYIDFSPLPDEIDPGIEIDLESDDEEYEYIDLSPLPENLDPEIEIELEDDESDNITFLPLPGVVPGGNTNQEDSPVAETEPATAPSKQTPPVRPVAPAASAQQRLPQTGTAEAFTTAIGVAMLAGAGIITKMKKKK